MTVIGPSTKSPYVSSLLKSGVTVIFFLIELSHKGNLQCLCHEKHKSSLKFRL